MKRSLQRREGFLREQGTEGAESVWIRRRPWKAPGIVERVLMDPPAEGTWNGQKVVVGTGEALLGPEPAGLGARLPITGYPGKWSAAERESEGVVVVMTGRTTQPVPSEGPLLHRCMTGEWASPRRADT